MKAISRIAILAVVGIALVASAQPTSASCTSARLIGGCGDNGCKYIYTSVDGQNPGESTLSGNFWGLGAGNPVVVPGDDNGAVQARAFAGLDPDWVHGTPMYLAGSWGNAGHDGCADNAEVPDPKRTVVSLSDVAPSKIAGHQLKNAGYFAVLCQQANANANYDYSFSAGNHVLKAIPYPSVASSSGSNVVINPPSAAGLAAGTYAISASCVDGAHPLITGYRLCTKTGVEPTGLNRNSDGWTCGAALPLNSPPQTVAVPSCAATPTGTVFFVANSLVYDSGFETLYVSEDTKISCNPATADRPGDFRIIKKPKDVQRRRQ